MAYLEELLPEFRKGAKIRLNSWPEDKYIYQKDGEIKENRGGCFYFGYNYMNCDGWELYQEPIDWDYIIKNKCLCWFWDDDGDMPVICAGLIEVESGKFSGFRVGNGSCWRKCRPVRRDEVTFYESGEDEQK